MNFEFSEQQRMIRDMARDFAQKSIAPVAAELDHSERFPADIVRQMGELGFMGMNVAEAYGGAGLDTVCYVLAMEEISKACASCGVIMSVNNSLVCWPLETYGSEAQKQRFLKPLAQGQLLGAYCLSEPGAGTDAAAQSDHREEGRRRLGPQRHEELHHQRRQRRRADRLRPDRPQAQAQGHRRLHRRDREPRLLGDPQGGEDGHPRLGHRPAGLRQREGARRPAAGRRWGRASGSP